MGMFQKYWWVLGTSPAGKGVLLGPFENETDAMEAEGDLEEPKRIKLSTRNQTKATKIIRQKLREQGSSTDAALSRKLHAKGLAREMGKESVQSKSQKDTAYLEGDPFEDGE
jgi:hypothetical protein